MSEILDGIEGTICHMDDILIFGILAKEHDERVLAVLRRLQKAGIALYSKCEFFKKKIKFLGHLLSEDGVEMDPEKVQAMTFHVPTNITELQQFNGMTNQLVKFIPNLASINEPRRQIQGYAMELGHATGRGIPENQGEPYVSRNIYTLGLQEDMHHSR